MKIILKTKMEG